MSNNIIECKLESTYKEIYTGLWRYDYGQILRITGVEFPKAVEIQFSLNEKSGSTITRIGTTVDGVTEVQIPNELLKNNGRTYDYCIYAYIYLTDETSGSTEYEIVLHVKSRTKPENPSEEPLPEPNIFHETVEAVNAAADRAEMAEQNAKASATEASKYASSASESAVAAEKTKEDALKEVGEKKREAIEAIQNQEETSVGKIVNHTDNEIKWIQNQIAESKGELEQTITNAGVSKGELNKSIETASDTKTALDKSTEMAGTAKTELDTSIQKAGTAKNALDKSTETAGTVHDTLSATVKQAGALDTSLGEKIETGIQLKTDIVASGEKAVKDIQTAGSEQLGKIQAVAEEFTADREQIAVNREDIGSLKSDLSNKITKFYASNQGETHLADSDNGKIEDMVLYGKSEQKQYKGINLFPPNTRPSDFVEVSIPKGSSVFWVTDGTPATGGNFRLFNEDKTENVWIGTDAGSTSRIEQLTIDAKYVQNLIDKNFDLSKICLGIGSDPIYEPYTGGIPSPSPDYPQEIKSVVNPVIKVCGKNLFDFSRLVSDGVNVMNYEKKTITVPAKTNNTGYNQTLRDLCPGITHGTYVFSMKRSNPNSGNGSYFLEAMKDFPINTPIELTDELLDNHISWYNSDTSEVENVISEIQIEKGNVVTSYEPYHEEQIVTLPYTLNAIPVSSGGNVTINGQQWVCDEVDLERGVKVQRVNRLKLDDLSWKHELTQINKNDSFISDVPASQDGTMRGDSLCQYAVFSGTNYDTEMTESSRCYVWTKVITIQFKAGSGVNSLDAFSEWLKAHPDASISYCLAVPIETTLTNDEIAVFNAFTTYYPVTNISVNSEQLDGYTVFNYPISLANGWNYVKQQLGDTRDYIYDMDAKAQDIDIQSAEAYVNSEYAVALTELEVM